MHQLIASPHNGTFLVARPDSRGGIQTRRPRTPHNERCGNCGGSADQSETGSMRKGRPSQGHPL
ncbi:hypothetical protein C5746_21310 [Streptomyces atratus]|uniref:Uncharacterized protein n=1 Tax=Streptomyces atratus TaxID=1893 RepID=A0A2Z5JFA8_STRAR|nr:hypothetical protein C5746_21310 [Streptomyces atratus]